jgi:ADP-heptose:LPS heptosyltransferase
MNLGLMRWIDKYIGVPLCFLISVFDNAAKSLGFNKPQYKRQIKKALFIELSEMGSAILAYPAMNRLKELHHKAELYFLIFDENKESVKLLNLIPERNILTIRAKSPITFVLDTLKVLFKIRRLKLDIVFDLELFARFSAILVGLSGANLKVGFYKYSMEGLYRGRFLTHRVEYNPYMHISLNFMSLVYSLVSPDDYPLTKGKITISETKEPKLKSDKKDINSIYKKIESISPNFKRSNKIIVFNPNAGLLPIRAWPLENYVELAKRIVGYHKDVFVVIMGVKGASKDAKEICSSVNERCVDLTNRTTLKEVVDLFNVSKVLITNDSGPAHFASLTPIKNIVFFGPETPKLYSPLGKNCVPVYSNFACSPCVSAFNHRKTLCKDNKCLKTIKVDDVYNLVKKEL